MPSRHTISLADPLLGENSRGIKPSRAMTVAFSLARRLSRPADASTNSQGPALVIVHSFTPAAQADLDIGHQPALWFARTTLSGNSLTMARLSAAFPPLYRDMPPSSSEGDFSCGPSPHRQPVLTRQRTGFPSPIAVVVFAHFSFLPRPTNLHRVVLVPYPYSHRG